MRCSGAGDRTFQLETLLARGKSSGTHVATVSKARTLNRKLAFTPKLQPPLLPLSERVGVESTDLTLASAASSGTLVCWVGHPSFASLVVDFSF